MKLQRSKLINYEKQWLKNHPKVHDNPIEYISFLDGLNEIISKHEYELDARFVTYGRRDFLRKEFSDYLNERTYCGRGKYNDAFVDLTDYYSGNGWISMSSVPEGINFREVDNANIEYQNEGIICKQEIDIIVEMIREFKGYLDELNNNSKSDKVENCMNKIIDEYEPSTLTEEEKEFNKYSKLYEEQFGKLAYIAEPSGTMRQTIDAIKTCLEKNEDLLDSLLYPEID